MGVNRMDHAAIRVADLGKALEWYEDIIGLKVLDRSAGCVHLACQGEAADLTVVAGGQGLITLAWGVDSTDDLDALERRLGAAGVASDRIRNPDRPGTSEVVRFRLPSGQLAEFAVATGDRVAGRTVYDWDGQSHTPTDIDHVSLLGETDPKDVVRFVRDVLGFYLSIRIEVGGDWVATWTRATPVDHDFAYMRNTRATDRLHHVAFTMIDGNHYVKLADQLARHGHRFEFGPGRHAGNGSGTGLGTNLFAYAFDPTGNRNEFSGDMKEYEPETPPLELESSGEVDELMNAWANNMPITFMTVGS